MTGIRSTGVTTRVALTVRMMRTRPGASLLVAVLSFVLAALAAAKILALIDPVVHDAVVEYQKSQTRKIVSDDEEIRS